MKKYIKSPFYKIKNNKLYYLNKIELFPLSKEKNIREKMLIDEGALLELNQNYKSKESSILVLEPHPDDFALSAFGYIKDNKKAIVLNIFSKMKLDSFTWNKEIEISDEEYEKIRLDEDKLAIETILKQDYISLKEQSTRISKKSDKYIIDRILNETNKILNKNKKIDTIMIPMGVGMHPDHIIVFKAILEEYINQIATSIKICFYPEYPYSRCKKLYYERLEQLQKKYKIKEKVINIEPKLNKMVNACSVYRSQYNDVNKLQMLAIIREDCIAISNEYNKKNMSLVYFELER